MNPLLVAALMFAQFCLGYYLGIKKGKRAIRIEVVRCVQIPRS